MTDFKSRYKIKKRIYSKITVFLLLIIVAMIAHGTWGIFQKSRASKQKLAVSNAAYEELQKRYQSMEEEVDYLTTQTGLEEEVRTKYNMAKEGEIVIVLTDDEEKDDNSNQPEEKGFWGKILPWIK